VRAIYKGSVGETFTFTLLWRTCIGRELWEDNLVVTNLVWRKVHGQLRKTRNSSLLFLPMDNVVGGLCLNLLAFGVAARVAVFVGLIIFVLIWREVSSLKQRSSLLLISMPVLATGFYLSYSVVLFEHQNTNIVYVYLYLWHPFWH